VANELADATGMWSAASTVAAAAPTGACEYLRSALTKHVAARRLRPLDLPQHVHIRIAWLIAVEISRAFRPKDFA
jgi:hypothetical protein